MARTDLTDARIGALKPRKSAYDLRDGKLGGFGVRVLPSGGKRLCRPLPASRRADLEDRRRRRGHGRPRSAVPRRACPRSDPPRERPAGRSRGDPLRGRRRGCVSETRAPLEAGGRWRSTAAISASSSCPISPGHQIAGIDRNGRRQLVRLAARHPCGSRPLDAGAVGHHARGRGDGTQAGGLQPLPGLPPLPTQGARTLPVGQRDPPSLGGVVGSRGALSGAGGDYTTSPPYRMPQGGDPDAALVRLPRGALVPARFENRSQNRLAVRSRAGDPRPAGTERPLGVSRAPGGRSEEEGLAGRVLGGCSAPRPILATSGFTTCAIRTRASRSAKARRCSPSAGCSDMPTRRRRSNTPISRTSWRCRPPRPSAPRSVGPDPWPARERTRLTDAAVSRVRPGERGVYGLGHARGGPRGPGREELRVVAAGRRPFETRLAGSGVAQGPSTRRAGNASRGRPPASRRGRERRGAPSPRSGRSSRARGRRRISTATRRPPGRASGPC